MHITRHTPLRRSAAPTEAGQVPRLTVASSNLAPNDASASARAEDHRATLRVAVVVQAEVALLHDPNTVHPAETLDVSPAGARFLLREPLPVDTAVRFRCVIPGRAQPVVIDADATIRSLSEVLADDTVLARDLYRHSAEFAPMPAALEDAIVSALLFIETRRS